MTLIAFLILLILLLCGYEANLPLFGLHGFFSIIFPYVLLGVVILFIIGLFFKRKLAIVMLFAVILVYPKIKNVIALSFPSTKEAHENFSSVKVMSWNVNRFIAPTENLINKMLDIHHFTDLINRYNPEVVALIDYAEKKLPKQGDISVQEFKKLTGLKYAYFSVFSKGYNSEYKFGTVILSKYPIQNKGVLVFENYHLKKYGISFIDISLKNDNPIRIYASHFQSFGLNEKDFKELQNLRYEQDFDSKSTAEILFKSYKSFSIRKKQVRDAEDFITQSKVPTILATDLNDVPNSDSYNIFKKYYDDAFVQKGFTGLGRTYLRLLPTLRIDYLLYSKQFELLDFKTIKKEVSDHYPIVGSFAIQ